MNLDRFAWPVESEKPPVSVSEEETCDQCPYKAKFGVYGDHRVYCRVCKNEKIKEGELDPEEVYSL